MKRIFISIPIVEAMGIVVAEDEEIIYRKQFHGDMDYMLKEMYFCLDWLIDEFSPQEFVAHMPVSAREKYCSAVVELLSQMHKKKLIYITKNRTCKVLFGRFKGVNFTKEIVKKYDCSKYKALGEALALYDCWRSDDEKERRKETAGSD